MDVLVSSAFVDPQTARPLRRRGEALQSDGGGETYPIIAGIPRFCPADNYADSFGRQWNLFEKTQIDGEGVASEVSATRLFAATGWPRGGLAGEDILEVGSGAGRFSRVLLENTEANLFSIDFSAAVEANWRNNGALGEGRFALAQASVYDLPFPDGRFDKVLCLGVLQHTPDFAASVRALVAKTRPGGEIVADFYPIRGWWTKIHAKYLLRPITKRIPHDRLLRLIDRNIDWLMALANRLNRVGAGALTRLLPLVDLTLFPKSMSIAEKRETALLDTFDMLSPEHDHPQRVEAVAAMFERAGARVDFAGFVDVGTGRSAIVRATRLGGPGR